MFTEDSDENPELTNLMNNLLADLHVSTVGGMAVNLARQKGDNPLCILLVINSCCGNTAYELPLDFAASLVEGLGEALSRVPKIDGEPRAN